MSIGNRFSTFCSSLRMSSLTVSNISDRAKQISKRVNSNFRGINSETDHSLFVGSYGRGTDIHTSDIDLIIALPRSTYLQYNNYSSNGQSALIQTVKNSIKETYPNTYIRGDGQVIKVNFSDGICYEVVPCFLNSDYKSYTYPDSNNGGKWKLTNPRDEILEINIQNILCNKNLKRLCRMARAWKDTWNVNISGLLIDTLAYNFLKQWAYRTYSYNFYDWMTRDFFKYLKDQNPRQGYWLAPGSLQYVYRTGNFEYKAQLCYNISLKALEYEYKSCSYSATQEWRKIYGRKFPY